MKTESLTPICIQSVKYNRNLRLVCLLWVDFVPLMSCANNEVDVKGDSLCQDGTGAEVPE